MLACREILYQVFAGIGKDFTVIFSLTAFGRSLNLSDNRVNQVLSDKP